MLFSKVAQTFEEIEKVSSRLEMTLIVSELFKEANFEEIAQLIYLFQGELGPSFESIDFGLGEKLIIQAISISTGFSEKEIVELYYEKGDLGLTADKLVCEKRQKSLFSEELTLEKVFSNFLKLASLEGSGSQDSKKKLLAELLNSSKENEAKFIVRLPLGTLRLGIGDPSLMDALALNCLKEFRDKNPLLVSEFELKYKKEEDVERQLKFKLREKIESVYNVFSDLGKIGSGLKKFGIVFLENVSIKPGIPIRPTLAERLASSDEIIKKLGNCIVEGKYDGFRFQIHKNKGVVKIFSRKQENMTNMFPDIVKAVLEQVDADTAVFEGEALAFKEETDEFFPFQITIQRKRKYEIDSMVQKLPLKLFVFDLMFLNGKELLNLPFKERRFLLKGIVKKGEIINLTEAIETNNPKEVDSFFEKSVEKGLEGIIAKDLNAKYIAGARKFAWIKLKRSYKNELSDTLDLVIVGFFSGRGSRTKFGLGGLLVACYNSETDTFESIAKIGSGLKEEDLSNLFKTLTSLKVDKKPNRVLSGIEPHFWVSPEKVIEVNADEITKSPVHLAGKKILGYGLALRFPRLVKERFDKKAEDATSVVEAIEMFSKQKTISLDGVDE